MNKAERNGNFFFRQNSTNWLKWVQITFPQQGHSEDALPLLIKCTTLAKLTNNGKKHCDKTAYTFFSNQFYCLSHIKQSFFSICLFVSLTLYTDDSFFVNFISQQQQQLQQMRQKQIVSYAKIKSKTKKKENRQKPFKVLAEEKIEKLWLIFRCHHLFTDGLLFSFLLLISSSFYQLKFVVLVCFYLLENDKTTRRSASKNPSVA